MRKAKSNIIVLQVRGTRLSAKWVNPKPTEGCSVPLVGWFAERVEKKLRGGFMMQVHRVGSQGMPKSDLRPEGPGRSRDSLSGKSKACHPFRSFIPLTNLLSLKYSKSSGG